MRHASQCPIHVHIVQNILCAKKYNEHNTWLYVHSSRFSKHLLLFFRATRLRVLLSPMTSFTHVLLRQSSISQPVADVIALERHVIREVAVDISEAQHVDGMKLYNFCKRWTGNVPDHEISAEDAFTRNQTVELLLHQNSKTTLQLSPAAKLNFICLIHPPWHCARTSGEWATRHASAARVAANPPSPPSSSAGPPPSSASMTSCVEAPVTMVS